MKRCPECRRDYYDETLLYCLDDGNALLEGPKSEPPASAGGQFGDEPATAILSEPGAVATGFPASESPTRAQIHTTDQTATLPRKAEAEPHENLGELLERQSLSAHQAAKPPGKVGGRQWQLAVFAGAVFLLVAGFFAYRYFTPFGSTQINSIAVMPFVNESGNADIEYLSDGMTETLINSLSQIPNLNVKARSSVFRYKGKEIDPKKIAAELNVQAILTGRVVQRGNHLVLNLELVDAQTENTLWGNKYERKSSELVALQSDVARDVSSKLKLKLSGADQAKVTKNNTQNAEAYQLYLQGRYFWNKRTVENLRKSVDYFQQAIAKDPNYALGYAGLADAYTLLAYYDGSPAQEVMPMARNAASKAVSLDDNSAEAHSSLGFILAFFDYDYAGAEREYRRVIELDPNYALAHQNLGVMLHRTGRREEGMAEIKRAMELEPMSIVLNRLYGDALIGNRRYDEALAQLKKTLELDPGFPTTHLSLSSVYQLRGNFAESAESYAKYKELAGMPQTATLARESFKAGGWNAYLRGMTGSPVGISSFIAATFHTQLGEHDKAFAELGKALENREWLLLYIKVDPRLDPLRDDPRFADLVKRMRFPE